MKDEKVSEVFPISVELNFCLRCVICCNSTGCQKNPTNQPKNKQARCVKHGTRNSSVTWGLKGEQRHKQILEINIYRCKSAGEGPGEALSRTGGSRLPVGERSTVTARGGRGQGHERMPSGHQGGQDAQSTPGSSLPTGTGGGEGGGEGGEGRAGRAGPLPQPRGHTPARPGSGSGHGSAGARLSACAERRGRAPEPHGEHRARAKRQPPGGGGRGGGRGRRRRGRRRGRPAAPGAALGRGEGAEGGGGGAASPSPRSRPAPPGEHRAFLSALPGPGGEGGGAWGPGARSALPAAAGRGYRWVQPFLRCLGPSPARRSAGQSCAAWPSELRGSLCSPVLAAVRELCAPSALVPNVRLVFIIISYVFVSPSALNFTSDFPSLLSAALPFHGGRVVLTDFWRPV